MGCDRVRIPAQQLRPPYRQPNSRPVSSVSPGSGPFLFSGGRKGASRDGTQNVRQPVPLLRPRISWCITSTRPRGVGTVTIGERLRSALPGTSKNLDRATFSREAPCQHAKRPRGARTPEARRRELTASHGVTLRHGSSVESRRRRDSRHDSRRPIRHRGRTPAPEADLPLIPCSRSVSCRLQSPSDRPWPEWDCDRGGRI
jgi:hypothetical protein